MDPTEGCHVAVLTPAGRGAVATICIVGPQAAAHVTAHFRPAAGRPLDAFPTGRVVFGRWSPAGTAGEEVVVCRRTDDVVEIHCHGGRFAAGTIVDSLVASGARAVSWQEFGARHETGGLEAEARVALAAARTERAAALLLDQWRGALRASLTQAVACIECGQTSRGEGILSELERWAVVGLHLVDPWRVVLTGRPNVGKSSLINAILGFERCIVHAAPGTTRDVVTAHTALDGWLAELADTAGWRDSGDEIETAGLQRARQQLRQADLVVLVFDHSAGWTAEDDALLAAWPGAVIVHNKCDLPPARSEGRPPGLRVSAPEGTGLDTLVRELAHRLVPATPPPGTAIVFSRRQREAVQCALSDLACGRGPEAAAALQELLATGGRDDAARGTVGFV